MSRITDKIIIYMTSESPMIVTPECQVKKEGQKAIVFCNVTGLPATKLSWYNSEGDKLEKNGDLRIDNGNGSSFLTITSVTASDTGIYTCKAEDGNNSTESSGTLLVPCKYITEDSSLAMLFSATLCK